MNATLVTLQLLGSVALLLWGVRMVRTGMTRAFGALLRRTIALSARSRFAAFGAGLAVTGLLQSSTATTLILASFAARGLIALPVALAMVLGADVGATIAAQIFTFEVKALWSVFLAGGFVLFTASERDRPRNGGRILMGIGMMLLALLHTSATAATLEQSAAFTLVLRGMSGEPLIAFVVAAAATWLAHSSLAMVLFVVTLAAANAISTPLAMTLVLGANVGGALAAFMAVLGSTARGRRVALGNLAMRFAGAIVALMLLAPAQSLLAQIEPAPGRLVVNFHTAFNLAVALVFLGLLGPVAKALEKLMPERAEPAQPAPRHLDPNALDTPAEALACAMRETLALGDRVADMLDRALRAMETSDPRLVREVEKADDAVDAIYEAIKLYLVKITRSELSEDESRRHVEILTFVTNLEHIGDIIDKNLMDLATKKIRNRLTFSQEGLDEIRRFHALIAANMRLALNVFATRDLALARRLAAEKTVVRSAELAAAESHYARLKQGRPESLETSSIHLDVIRDLKRINGHLTSAAYPILEAAGELSESRLREQEHRSSTPEAPVISD